MTATLVQLTARQLLNRRRVLLLLLLALVPVAIALLYRFGSDRTDPLPLDFAPDLMDALMLALVLPITALIFGTGALGSEIEDGTAVYLLTKPIDRRLILLIKVGVATLATLILTLPSTLLSSLIILGGDDPDALTAGFVAGVAAGSLAYCALFVALSVRTSRALLIGLGYVFIWEAIVTNIFDGLSWVSVREYMLGLADLVSSAGSLDAQLDGGSALVAALILVGASLVAGSWLVGRFEVGERL